MLKIFPPLYLDEYFYSWISRYHTYSGNLLLRQTKNDLFEISNRDTGYTGLLKNLDAFCSKTNEKLCIDPWYIIKNHTEYPIFLAFNNFGANLDDYRKVVSLTFDSDNLLKFKMKVCPKCILEQMERYGECYFVKYHQENSIKFCYKHKMPLRVFAQNRIYREFYDINSLDIYDDFQEELVFGDTNNHIQIANAYKDIVDGQLEGLNINDVMLAYKLKLGEKDYKKGAFINRTLLAKDFTDFYGEKLLSQLNCYNDTVKSWVTKMCSPTERFNFIKHLLFIVFLFRDIPTLKRFIDQENPNDKDYKFKEIVLASSNAKNTLLKELHCSLNVAYQKSMQYGIADVFLEKMQGYFDEENVNRCKAVIENYVLSYNGNLSLFILSRVLSGEYKIIQAWDKDWLINLISKKNGGLFE